jgi:hypothetical protein
LDIQKRILTFVTRANWVLFTIATMAGVIFAPLTFTLGILSGGLIVTINFHLLARTLRNALTPPHLSSHNVVIAKYYVRFIVSGLIIFFLISQHIVNPLGLFVGLSVVVASIVMAALCELKHLMVKEAV